MSLNTNNDLIEKNPEKKLFNFLGNKRCRLETPSNNQVNPINGKFSRSPFKCCNFKLKKNKNRFIHVNGHKLFKPTFRQNKNVCRPFDEQIKKAPHNTSQYLITNYSKGRTDKFDMFSTMKLLFCKDEASYTKQENESDVDDICITGGTMKGILSSNFKLGFDVDSLLYEEFEKYQSQERLERNHLLFEDTNETSQLSTEFSIDDDDVELDRMKDTEIYEEITIEKIQTNISIKDFNENSSPFEDNASETPTDYNVKDTTKIEYLNYEYS